MTALLDQEIPKQNFEVIGERIVIILSEELANQFTLFADPDLDLKVFHERAVPFDKIDNPVANVAYSSSNFTNTNPKQNDGNHTYYIDVYGCGQTDLDNNNDGDKLASQKVQKILAKIKAILQNPVYNTLAFSRPSVSNTLVSNITMSDPRNNQDGSHMTMGRISYTVRMPDSVQLIEATPIDGWKTVVKLADLS